MKAILVLDVMPQNCLYCPCYRQAKYEYIDDCAVVLRPLTVEERDNRPSWCPLKPMPKYYTSTSNPQRIEYLKKLGMTEKEQYYYELGHDDCIDELLVEEERNTKLRYV